MNNGSGRLAIVLHSHALRRGLRDVALRRGVALRGGSDGVRAVAGAAGGEGVHPPGTDHPLGHPGPRRPARRARRPRAPAALPARPARHHPRARRRGLPAGGEPRWLPRWSAPAPTTRAPPTASTRSATAASPAAWRVTRPGRPARPTQSCRCWSPTPACRLRRARRDRRTPGMRARGGRRHRGARLLGLRVRPTLLRPSTLEEAGVRDGVDLADVLPGALTPLATSDWAAGVPLDLRTSIELVWRRGRLPDRWRLPRLAPQDRSPPPSVGQRRRGL